MRIAFIVALVSASIFPAFAQTTATIPHFACGGGWSTTVMFTNGLWYPLSSSSNPWRLHFTIDVRSQDNRQLFSSVQSLSNSPETYTHTFTCDSDQIQTGRIDWTFYDSELAVFNQPQRKLRPLANLLLQPRGGHYGSWNGGAQFMSGVDTITGQDSKGNTTWLRCRTVLYLCTNRSGRGIPTRHCRVKPVQPGCPDPGGIRRSERAGGIPKRNRPAA